MLTTLRVPGSNEPSVNMTKLKTRTLVPMEPGPGLLPVAIERNFISSTWISVILQTGAGQCVAASCLELKDFSVSVPPAVTALMFGVPAVGKTSDVMVFSPPLMKTSTEL